MAVFVLDKRKKPLMPCSEKRARLLLERGRARVHRVMPFTIRLVDRYAEDSAFQPIRVKIDPGSKTTGIAVVREEIAEPVQPQEDGKTEQEHATQHVLSLINLTHRGWQISESLTARSNMRRRRRGQLRYRAPRFLNRTKPKGWLAPSLRHRIETTMSWMHRIARWVPVTAISQELVRFDMQKHENPEISGTEYQQGELAGYEVREYLLEKWGRKCAYCSAENVPLQVEHIHPKSRGGSNRISNLTLACQCCNQKKGATSIEEFLAKKPEVLKRILSQTKQPLKDAAAVNSTRYALSNALAVFGVEVEKSSGGRTKFNRTRFGIPKDHALDAACVGKVKAVVGWKIPTLKVKAMGRGTHQRTMLDKYGFPRGYRMRTKFINGFQTGDLVRAIVSKGKYAGTHLGRVAVRKTGSFDIGSAQGINHKHCKLIQRGCGYKFDQYVAFCQKSVGQSLN